MSRLSEYLLARIGERELQASGGTDVRDALWELDERLGALEARPDRAPAGSASATTDRGAVLRRVRALATTLRCLRECPALARDATAQDWCAELADMLDLGADALAASDRLAPPGATVAP